MKKVKILLFITTTIFIFTGCTSEERQINNNLKSATDLKEITGKITKATLNDDGKVVIKQSDITDKVTYINYEYENKQIGLLAVKDSKGQIKVVINTCQSCIGSPYAYFVQVGDKIECQNCGSMFDIDELDNLVAFGCNPIEIKDKKNSKGIITIGTEQLKNLEDKFTNWEGPKL